MSELSDMEAVIEAAREAGIPQTLDPDNPQAIVMPGADVLHIPDLRDWRERPNLRRRNDGRD